VCSLFNKCTKPNKKNKMATISRKKVNSFTGEWDLEFTRKSILGEVVSVDVWASSFGEVAEAAIIALYAKTFGVSRKNMDKYDFRHCVNSLRKKEDPSYEIPEYRKTTK